MPGTPADMRGDDRGRLEPADRVAPARDAELLAGAAGGVDGRLLVQPRAYAGVQLTPSVALRAGASRVKALDGRLNSNVFDLLLDFTYGVAAGN